jgi:hypothetical protein
MIRYSLVVDRVALNHTTKCAAMMEIDLASVERGTRVHVPVYYF